MAIGFKDETIAVVDKAGSLHWSTVRPTSNVSMKGQTCDGIVHWLRQSSADAESFVYPDNYRNCLRQDGAGNLVGTFYDGSRQVTGSRRKLFILRKRNGNWKLEGDREGPVVSSRLFLNPDGKMVGVIRQGQPELGPYSGRVLLAYENEDEKPWPTEVVSSNHNAGFYPWLIFDDQSRVETLLHFDHGYQRLLKSKRTTVASQWSKEVLAGNTGLSLQGLPFSDGSHQFLMRRLVRWDSWEPTQFASLTANGKFSISPGKGEFPFVLTDDRVVSYDRINQNVFCRREDGTWFQIARFSSRKELNFPSLIAGDFLASCHSDRDSVLVSTLDVKEAISVAEQTGKPVGPEHSAWRIHRVMVEENLTEATQTELNVSSEGRLQVMLYRDGPDGYLAIVESVEKFEPKTKGVVSDD